MTPASRPLRLGRRHVLGTGIAAGVALLGVAADGGTADAVTSPYKRYRYGKLSNQQFADLWLPIGTPIATVVLLHGGSYLSTYKNSQLNPMAAALVASGYAVWNVEFRRVGNGGGYPDTFADVAAAVDLLSGSPYGAKVVMLGYSSGGELAAWAASRTELTPGGAPKQPFVAAITLSGGLDLTGLAASPTLGSVVTNLMGGGPDLYPDRYALADPGLLLPPACPIYAVQAAKDGVMPPTMASDYVAKVQAAGGTATFVSVPGTHNSIKDPKAASWPTIASLVQQVVPA